MTHLEHRASVGNDMNDVVEELPLSEADTSLTATPRRLLPPIWLSKLLYALLGLALFVIALELLKKGAGSFGREVIGFLHISSPTNSLGFGWLLAYLFLSGSPVAAVAVSFFASGTISATQTFTMITGSRLGASFVVLFVGFLYHLRGHSRNSSVAIGVLALLTTAAIYLPALPIGYWLLTSGLLNTVQLNTATPLASALDFITDPVMGLATSLLPGWALLLSGVITLLLAFSLFDRALPAMDLERGALRQHGWPVYHPLALFLIGAGITSVTLSVSVSLSILVPLAARRVVRREHAVPYIMGANITTFIDTLVAALIAGGPAAFTIVLVEMVSVAVLSLLVLLCCYRPFERVTIALQERITANNRALALFVGVLLIIPLVLLMAP